MQPYKGMDEEKGKGLNGISWPEHQPRMCGELFFELQIYEVSLHPSLPVHCLITFVHLALHGSCQVLMCPPELPCCSRASPANSPFLQFLPHPAATVDIPEETEHSTPCRKDIYFAMIGKLS